jgi:hypothetical protein
MFYINFNLIDALNFSLKLTSETVQRFPQTDNFTRGPSDSEVPTMSENPPGLSTCNETLASMQEDLEKRYGKGFITKVADNNGLEFAWFCKSGAYAKVTVHSVQHKAIQDTYLRICIPKGIFSGLITTDQEDSQKVLLTLANGKCVKIFADVDKPVYCISVFPWRTSDYNCSFNEFVMAIIHTSLMA